MTATADHLKNAFYLHCSWPFCNLVNAGPVWAYMLSKVLLVQLVEELHAAVSALHHCSYADGMLGPRWLFSPYTGYRI